ncbi:NAD(P)-dependent oxidoreductase [Halobacteriales archaeon QS_8_69_26]|nr:MAG: NAD(P)-dependent oxidoreductase [Halobacteriales archaeon QS_8_69_26]
MRVAILGCGYVGLELGRRLTDAGHGVVGVRRSESGLADVQAAGVTPVRADVTDPESLSAVGDVDAVVYAVSAGGRGVEAAREAYVEGLRTAIDALGDRDDPPDRLVYTGSTGVYGDHGGEWVDESTPPAPDTERGEVLLEAERIARERSEERGIDGTVARFAGLYGPDRYRIDRYLDGPVTEGWLNLLHRADAAGAVAHLLTEDLARDEVVLVVDDEPVRRPDLAAWLAEQVGAPAPSTRTVAERLSGSDLPEGSRARIRADKRCSNAKLRGLGYEFEFPTYREGYREAVEEYASGE